MKHVARKCSLYLRKLEEVLDGMEIEGKLWKGGVRGKQRNKGFIFGQMHPENAFSSFLLLFLKDVYLSYVLFSTINWSANKWILYFLSISK